FLWAEAVATTCYTQNRSIIRLHYKNTPYELLHNKIPNLSFLYVFGALCYPTNDSENLGKLEPKADIGIFIGYAPTEKAFRIYNRHTRRIVETIHVDFDELTAMAFEQSRVNLLTSASRSQPQGNTKKDRIQRTPNGVDLLNGSQGNNLYTLSLRDMMTSSPICLLSKALKTKSRLWHHHLSHLNFGAINHLARQGFVRGLPKLKFEKDHLYFACAMGKSKKKSHKPKSEDTNQEKLYLLHMDLCGPMCVESVNGKKYILVIVDDYSRFTWVKCLRSKDEAPDFIVGISHETLVARSLQQNGVVERRNRTLIEAARTISGPALNEMTPATISSGLVPTPSSSTPYVPPSRNDWDLLFQPLFDELLTPPLTAEVIARIAEVIPQVDADSTCSPSSTTVDQDAPSPSKSLTPTEIQSSVTLQDVGNDNLDMEVAHMGNDPLLGVPICYL
nr:ribonuclease H-like domain-containing protein [Tanacetum cinerariifolium]